MIRSSSSTDQERSKEDVKKGEPEQELEVTCTMVCLWHSWPGEKLTITTWHLHECSLFYFVMFKICLCLVPAAEAHSLSAECLCEKALLWFWSSLRSLTGVGEPGGGSGCVSRQQGSWGACVYYTVWYQRPLHPHCCQRSVGAQHSEHPGDQQHSVFHYKFKLYLYNKHKQFKVIYILIKQWNRRTCTHVS